MGMIYWKIPAGPKRKLLNRELELHSSKFKHYDSGWVQHQNDNDTFVSHWVVKAHNKLRVTAMLFGQVSVSLQVPGSFQ